MTTLILHTNSNIYQVVKNDAILTITFSDGREINNPGQFIKSMGGVEAVLNRCKEFDGSVQEYVEKINLANLERREEIQAKRNEEVERIKALKANPNATAKELYEAFSFELRKNKMAGWALVDEYFLSENILSKTIVSKIGSYTATPYDDGAIIIKSGNKRFSNNRRFAKSGYISDLLD